jgi:hypothetical protein
MTIEFEKILANGPLAAEAAAAQLGVSVSTVARYARESDATATLGAARATRYALFGSLLGERAEQPLFWVDAQGECIQFAILQAVHGERFHVGARGLDVLSDARALPWFLTSAMQTGYLGRATAARFSPAPLNFESDPANWAVAQHLFVALQRGTDSPGAILIGERAVESWRAAGRTTLARDEYEAVVAAGVAASGRAGTSAGGEQPKFTAVRQDGTHVIVKFSPPRGTPLGETWHQLLTMEHLASEAQRRSGANAAPTQLVTSSTRTFLESERIDRVGVAGRKHAIPFTAIHAAFVKGPTERWPRTAHALVAQRRLSQADADAITRAFRFGKWIGNDDMHFGNLSVMAESPANLKKPTFALAPIYDMLPMRYRPEQNYGDMQYSAFAVDPPMPGEERLDDEARAIAATFWGDVANHHDLHPSVRALGEVMAARASAAKPYEA